MTFIKVVRGHYIVLATGWLDQMGFHVIQKSLRKLLLNLGHSIGLWTTTARHLEHGGLSIQLKRFIIRSCRRRSRGQLPLSFCWSCGAGGGEICEIEVGLRSESCENFLKDKGVQMEGKWKEEGGLRYQIALSVTQSSSPMFSLLYRDIGFVSVARHCSLQNYHITYSYHIHDRNFLRDFQIFH